MSHILVFSTDVKQQEWICSALYGRHVVSVVETANAAARMVRCSETPVDIVIAEWFEYDGLRVIEEIRRLHGITPPPIVLTTYFASLDVDRATVCAIARGADWFLPLPMARSKFLEEVESCISQFGSPESSLRSTGTVVPARTAEDLTDSLLGMADVAMMIDQTVGPEYLKAMLDAAINAEGLKSAQECAVRIIGWACSLSPILEAVSWSEQYGKRLRTPSEDLLLHIAHGILFRLPSQAA